MHIFLKFYIFLWKNKSFLFFFMAIIPLICYSYLNNNKKSAVSEITVNNYDLSKFNKSNYLEYSKIDLKDNVIGVKVMADSKALADESLREVNKEIITDISYAILQKKKTDLDHKTAKIASILKKQELLKKGYESKKLNATEEKVFKDEINVLESMYQTQLAAYQEQSLALNNYSLDENISVVYFEQDDKTFVMMLLSFVVAFFVALFAGLVRKIANNSYDDEAPIRKATQLKVLEGFPKLKKFSFTNNHLMAGPLKLHSLTEISRIFKYISAADKKVIEVVSSIRNEGNSSLVFALAEHASKNDKKVLVVDLNLRTMDLSAKLAHNIAAWNIENKEYKNIDSNILNIGRNLDFLPALKDEQSVEILKNSQNLKELFAHLKETYDYIFIDTTAAFSVNIHNVDPVIIASAVDGVVVNYLSNKTSRYALLETVDKLRMVEGNILCVVTNNKYNAKLKSELLAFCRYLEKVNKSAAEYLRVKILKSYILDEE